MSLWDRILAWWQGVYGQQPDQTLNNHPLPEANTMIWPGIEPPEEAEPPDPDTEPPEDLHVCPSCEGQGQIASRGWDGGPVWRDCPRCDGTGAV